MAELTAARLLGAESPLAPLADNTLIVTFGSPGSTESAENLNQLNIVHTDDFVAQLSASSPLFEAAGVGREGTDLAVERPEARLPNFDPADLASFEALAAALQDPRLFIEHRLALYLDTAELLDSAEAFVPTVRDAADDLFRWLDVDIDRTVVGTEGSDIMRGGTGNDLIFARGGADLVFGQGGGDILIASDGNNLMQGGAGNDRFHAGSGNNLVDGGPGIDTAIFDGARDAFSIFAFGSFAKVSRGNPAPERTVLGSVEMLAFDDVTLALAGGKSTPVAPSLAASVSVDDLVITSEVV